MSLQQRIIERIQHDGPIPFAEYMRMALYEPGYGYYVIGPARMGWEGDYYTSTDVSPFFAHSMGRQLQQMWEALKRPSPFVVLEQGAGRGHLVEGIRSWAAQEQPDLHAALEYRTEDIRMGQNALLAHESPRIDAHEVTEQAPHVFLSNELIDAFPVHIVEKREHQLNEVYVDIHHGRLHEVLSEPSNPEIVTYLDDYKIPWRDFDEGWRAEINLDAQHWMAQTAQQLLRTEKRKRHGFVLVIDYGDKARDLYTPYRYRGTLACYFQHQLTDRPLARPGEQDITAHVNFSALIAEGRRQGLRLQSFTTQRQWLESTGIYQELEQIYQRDFALAPTERASDQGQIALLQWKMVQQRVSALTDPHGMGNFKVLIMKH